MKKKLVVTFTIFALLLILKVPVPATAANVPLGKAQAVHIIRRSTVVIIAAQEAAKNGHQTLGLAKAIRHQLYARDLYLSGLYNQAIFHSLRARTLALRIIKRNNGDILQDYLPDRLEEKYAQKAPLDQELDAEIQVQNQKLDNQSRDNIEISTPTPGEDNKITPTPAPSTDNKVAATTSAPSPDNKLTATPAPSGDNNENDDGAVDINLDQDVN